jgi:hypothetical protein
MAEAQPRRSPSEEEVAAGIALVLMGEAKVPGVPTKSAVASLLALLLPTLPAALSARVSGETAALALRDLPEATRGSGALAVASRTEFSYRAAYALAAVGRLADAAASGGALGAPLAVEAGYFGAHREASRRRLASARLQDAAAGVWGPILGWRHGVNGTSIAPRPHHVAASGANYDVRNGPPVETGGWPSSLRHCSCAPGPPVAGARMLR